MTSAEQRVPELWLPCPHCGRLGIDAQSSVSSFADTNAKNCESSALSLLSRAVADINRACLSLMRIRPHHQAPIAPPPGRYVIIHLG